MRGGASISRFALPLICLPAFVARKAKQLAFRSLREPLLNSR
jgi:hypothetical protein